MKTGMKQQIIERTGQRRLVFRGELIGSAQTSDNSAHYNYDGRVGCWTEASLYRTTRGQYVCALSELTCWDGAPSEHTALVVDTGLEVIEFFGRGRMAKRLYERAGIAETEKTEAVDCNENQN